MATIAWAGPALEDLRQTYQFIARDAKQYTSIMVRRIRTAVARLGDFPQSGRVVPEFPDGPYREVLVGPYRVVYRHVEARDLVLVLAVMHGSRLCYRAGDKNPTQNPTLLTPISCSGKV